MKAKSWTTLPFLTTALAAAALAQAGDMHSNARYRVSFNRLP